MRNRLGAADLPDPVPGWVLILTHEGDDDTRVYRYVDPDPDMLGANLVVLERPDGTLVTVPTLASFGIADRLTRVP